MTKEWYLKNKEELNARSRKYYQEHKSEIKISMAEYHKNYRLEHRDKNNDYARKYYIENKDKMNEKNKLNYINNKKRYIERTIRNHKKARKTNIQFKIRDNLRRRLNRALKNNFKPGNTIKLLGCSIEFLKNYLAVKFTPGMTWENYGKWHIDHIRPCSSYDMTRAEEQALCFNYTNLQPLWAKDNIIKGKKYITRKGDK